MKIKELRKQGERLKRQGLSERVFTLVDEFNKKESKRILDRQFDVGVCGSNYTPVSLSEIESWIALYKKGRAQ